MNAWVPLAARNVFRSSPKTSLQENAFQHLGSLLINDRWAAGSRKAFTGQKLPRGELLTAINIGIPSSYDPGGETPPGTSPTR
ncbi:hypothetical protein L0156_28015 [bacterium]|nr:hypothetical protein [bacterium]